MSLITNTLMLLISLAGFIIGFILSIISPEELRPGKKYFVFIRTSLFYLITFFILSIFIYYQKYYFILILVIYLGWKLIIIKSCFIKKNEFFKEYFYLKEIMNYLFFIIVYIILITLNNQNFQLILLTLIFLYGLPAGSLLRLRFIRKQERKHEVKIKYT